MDKITVADLATECSVQNQVVFSELKRLGIYVGSPAATIDASFADTIRKKILAQRDAEESRALEAEKKKEALAEAVRKAEKKGLSKKAAIRHSLNRFGRSTVASRRRPRSLKRRSRSGRGPCQGLLAPGKGANTTRGATAELIEAAPPVSKAGRVNRQ